MAEPAQRRTDEVGGKFYEHPSLTEPEPGGGRSPDGTPWMRPARYTSVTTALGVKAKPALVFWAGNVTAERAMANLPKLTVDAFKKGCGRARARTEPLGCGNCAECTEAWLALTHHGEKERRAREGTSAHDVLERWILTGRWEYTPELTGDPAIDQYVPTQKVMAPYITALQTWADEYGLRREDFLVSECTVWNHRLKYAGTLDFIVVINPRTKKAAELCARVNHQLGLPLDKPVTILGDAKSREGEKARLYAEQPLQLTAYRNAETMTPKRGGGEMEIPMISTDGAAILQVRPDGFTFRLVVTDGRTMRAWESTLALYRWDAEHGDLSTQVQAHPLPDGWEASALTWERATVPTGGRGLCGCAYCDDPADGRCQFGGVRPLGRHTREVTADGTPVTPVKKAAPRKRTPKKTTAAATAGTSPLADLSRPLTPAPAEAGSDDPPPF